MGVFCLRQTLCGESKSANAVVEYRKQLCIQELMNEVLLAGDRFMPASGCLPFILHGARALSPTEDPQISAVCLAASQSGTGQEYPSPKRGRAPHISSWSGETCLSW